MAGAWSSRYASRNQLTGQYFKPPLMFESSRGDMTKRTIRPVRIEGDTAFITLTQGYESAIDTADLPMVQAFNWRSEICRTKIYAVRYKSIGNGERAWLRLHRVILNAPEGMEVDHINGDGLDNRRRNLRLASRSENARNRGATAANTSGFKGVDYFKPTEKYRAYITVHGKRSYLGYFDTAEEAHAAYAEAARALHGEFARV